MQPQMPYGAPQGPQGPQNPQGPQTPPEQQGPYGQPSQPYASQPGYPYPNQAASQYPGNGSMPSGQSPYGQAPTGQPAYGQQPMPQYQPPANYQARPGKTRPAPLPPPPPVQKTPYDFFMQQKHPINTKLPIPGPKQAGFRGKLIWVAGAALVIIIVVVAISALKPKDTTTQGLTTIAQTQQEVARVCDLGANKASAQINRNFAINCSTSVLSDQAQLIAYLGTQHVSLKAKQLGLLTNTSTDKSLSAASASSNYDAAFVALSTKQIVAYGRLVQQQLSSGQLGANAQALLTQELAHIKILVGNNASTASAN